MASVEFGNLEANLRFLTASEMIRPGVRVLEIGSGCGTLLKWLLDQGVDARGVEVSQERIAESRALYGALPLSATTGTTLRFPQGSFDLVISFDV